MQVQTGAEWRRSKSNGRAATERTDSRAAKAPNAFIAANFLVEGARERALGHLVLARHRAAKRSATVNLCLAIAKLWRGRVKSGTTPKIGVHRIPGPGQRGAGHDIALSKLCRELPSLNKRSVADKLGRAQEP